jgi:hypothetical protein
MNYIYASIYVVICVVLFFVIFMSKETFNFLFEKQINNITDCNHPEFTGGITYEFNPYRHLPKALTRKCEMV